MKSKMDLLVAERNKAFTEVESTRKLMLEAEKRYIDDSSDLTDSINGRKDLIRSYEKINSDIESRLKKQSNNLITANPTGSYINRFADIFIRFARSLRLIKADTKNFSEEEFDKNKSKINEDTVLYNEQKLYLDKLNGEVKQYEDKLVNLKLYLYQTKAQYGALNRDLERLDNQLEELKKAEMTADVSAQNVSKTPNMFHGDAAVQAANRRAQQHLDDDIDNEDDDGVTFTSNAPTKIATPEPRQSPPEFQNVKVVSGLFTQSDTSTIYIRVMQKNIDFHLGKSSEKISIPRADLVEKLGKLIPARDQALFFQDNLGQILTILQAHRGLRQKLAAEAAEDSSQKKAEVKQSIRDRESGSPDIIASILKSSPLSSLSGSPSSSRSPSPVSDSSKGSSVLSDEQIEQNRKQKEETVLKYRAIHIKDNGCKFIKLSDEASLTSFKVMEPLMHAYAGSVIALVGDKLFDVTKSVGRAGASFKAKEIPQLEAEGHLGAIQRLKTTIGTLVLGDAREAEKDLNLAIQVITGISAVVKKEEAQDVNKKALNENEKALLSPDAIKVIKGALIFCKSPQGEEPALLKTDLSISMLEKGDDAEIQSQLKMLYPQIDEQLAKPRHPREVQALTNLRAALNRCFPEANVSEKSTVSEEVAPPHVPLAAGVGLNKGLLSAIQGAKRPTHASGLSKDLLSEITKQENKDPSLDPKLKK
jgi:hypothetical protein